MVEVFSVRLGSAVCDSGSDSPALLFRVSELDSPLSRPHIFLSFFKLWQSKFIVLPHVFSCQDLTWPYWEGK